MRKFLLAFVCLTAAGMVLAGILIGETPVRWLARDAYSSELTGEILIPVGDRHVTVYFQTDGFPTPPLILATIKDISDVSYAVKNVRTESFRIELDQRAKTDTRFYWQAVWNRSEGKEHIESVGGMPEAFELEHAGRKAFANYSGYELYMPTEVWIEAEEAEALALPDHQLVEVVLKAMKEDFESRHQCGPLDNVRQALRLRTLACPPREVDHLVSEWPDFEVDAWKLENLPDGTRLYLASEAEPEIQVDDLARELAEILSEVVATDLSEHNNQAIDFVSWMEHDPAISQQLPIQVIHFDSHSDIWGYPDPRSFVPAEQIGDFLNNLMERQLVSDIYWVLPDWSRLAGFESRFYDSELKFLVNNEPEAYTEGPAVHQVYVEKQSNLMHFRTPDDAGMQPEKYFVIRIHKLTIDQLPSFEGQENVFLEFDADYFSNSGFDTMLAAAFNPSHGELRRSVKQVLDQLVLSNVKPILAYLCRSPKYASNEDQSMLAYWFMEGANAAGKSDLLIGYKHNLPTGKVNQARTMLRESALQTLLFKLAHANRANRYANELLFLDDDNSQYIQAMVQMQYELGLSVYEAETILIRADQFDGQLDGVLDFRDLEYYASLEDMNWITQGPAGIRWPTPLNQTRTNQLN